MKNLTININGVSKFFDSDDDIFLINVLETYIQKNKNIAVALNYKIISKSKWKLTKLNDQDIIEIVTPFPGG